MYIDYNDEQKALRKELREYFANLITDDLREVLRDQGESGPLYRKVIKQMGTDGWLAIGFPKEYGGMGKGPVEQ